MKIAWGSLLLLAACVWAQAADAQALMLHAQAEVLADADQTVTIELLRSGELDQYFAPGGELLPEIGPTRDQHWLRVKLPQALESNQWILRVNEVELNTLCLHWPVTRGEYQHECTGLRDRQQAGRAWHSDYLFDVPAKLDTGRPLYVRAQSNTWLTIPLEAIKLEQFMAQDHHQEFRWGLYHGALAALIILTLLAWADQRRPELLVFAVQHLAFFVVSFGWQGRPMEYEFWPAAPWWTANAPAVAMACYVTLGVLLHQVLLGTRQRMPRLHRVGQVLAGAALFAAAAGAVLPVWGYWLLGPLGLSYVALVLAYDILAMRQGMVAARFALVSIAIMLAAVLLKSFEALNIELVEPAFSLAMIRVGALVSGLFMLMALGAELRASRLGRREAEGRLLRRTQELEDINVELLEFAYAASHDLKEPLRGVSSFSSLLQRDYRDTLDERGQELLGIVADSAKRADRLLVDLIEYTEARNKPLQLEQVDSAALCKQAAAALESKRAGSEAELHISKLPVVQADPTLLYEVLLNMLDNALTYTAPGRQPIVHVDCIGKDGDWKFSVRDNGPGIPDNNLRRVFTLFHRQQRDNYDHTGMGLAMCKKAIQRHGGRLWVERNADAGVTFNFTLPIDSSAVD